MPNPRGPLSRAMPLSAIVAANKEIRLTKNSKCGSYHKYTPKEGADIGMVQRYIADMRKVGGAVSTGARGILLSQDRSRLAEFGGPATLTLSRL